MSQPDWEFVMNLGDADPLEYGGYFIFRDKTGVYPEEAEYLEINEHPADGDRLTHTVYCFSLDRLKMVDGYLVPFGYDSSWPHPVNKYDEWFHKNIAGMASTFGVSVEELEADFCSEDVCRRASAYRMIGEHYGFENLDADPLKLFKSQARARYADVVRS